MIIINFRYLKKHACEHENVMFAKPKNRKKDLNHNQDNHLTMTYFPASSTTVANINSVDLSFTIT
jgi:hypothetical protein